MANPFGRAYGRQQFGTPYKTKDGTNRTIYDPKTNVFTTEESSDWMLTTRRDIEIEQEEPEEDEWELICRTAALKPDELRKDEPPVLIENDKEKLLDLMITHRHEFQPDFDSLMRSLKGYVGMVYRRRGQVVVFFATEDADNDSIKNAFAQFIKAKTGCVQGDYELLRVLNRSISCELIPENVDASSSEEEERVV